MSLALNFPSGKAARGHPEVVSFPLKNAELIHMASHRQAMAGPGGSFHDPQPFVGGSSVRARQKCAGN